MVNILNSRQIHWNNTGWIWAMVLPGGVLMEIRKPATLVGAVKLAGGAILRTSPWLALDSREEMVSGQTTKQVLC